MDNNFPFGRGIWITTDPFNCLNKNFVNSSLVLICMKWMLLSVLHINNDSLLFQALFHALPMNYVSVAKLQSKLEGEANQTAVKRLIDKMTQDGYIEAKGYRRLGTLRPLANSISCFVWSITKYQFPNDGLIWSLQGSVWSTVTWLKKSWQKLRRS